MAFTSHGHKILGSINDGKPFEGQVARCGGPPFCEVCKNDFFTYFARERMANEDAVMKVSFEQFIDEVKKTQQGLIVSDCYGKLTLNVRHADGWYSHYESPDYLDVSHLDYVHFIDTLRVLINTTPVGQNVRLLNSRL